MNSTTRTGRILLVTGTGTEIGKTVVTAAVAALALDRGLKVAVLKPAQTGVGADEPGDADEVRRLAGEELTCVELARYPEPLAPATAAARSGLPPVTPRQSAEAAGSRRPMTWCWSRVPAGCWSATTRTAPRWPKYRAP